MPLQIEKVLEFAVPYTGTALGAGVLLTILGVHLVHQRKSSPRHFRWGQVLLSFGVATILCGAAGQLPFIIPRPQVPIPIIQDDWVFESGKEEIRAPEPYKNGTPLTSVIFTTREFDSPPIVFYAISGFDLLAGERNTRVYIHQKGVETNGFKFQATTNDGSAIGNLDVQWLAIGKRKGTAATVAHAN